MACPKAEYVEIPTWAVDSEHKGASAFAAALALTNNEGKWIRLSAATQRKLLGYAVFGKQHFLVEHDRVNVSRKSAYGTDCHSTEYHLSEIMQFAHRKKTLNR
jgi:hypothetical protein